ncbi:hypothetical protein C8A03DRAFT_42255 [Achaetomium macrosporum]|uniref:Uncharacterized protein n=1 Tax=Achaetomium macrosporum TaxID=79813 RepID=A0AAN7HH38_9PEZI|nr:hypothetical protein C8A03DRAFT_42255 [Achaetomium macrosporum]
MAQTQLPPIFITPADADDARLAPFYEEGFPKSGESVVDVIVRDQVRRSELLLGRPLTEKERECIRTAYEGMGQRHAPNEQSEPSTLHSPPAGAGVENTPEAICDALRILVAQLENKIGALETRLETAEKGSVSDRNLLDGAWADIAKLKLQKRDAEVRIASLENELQTVKTDLRELETRITANEESEAETDREPDVDTHHQDERPHQPGQQPQQANRFSLWGIAITILILQWTVTGAVLHSNRLTDGYGPYVNGGYNGLGSVLIFGSWIQVLAFAFAIGNLYHLVLSIALRR